MEIINLKSLTKRKRTILVWVAWLCLFALLRWNSFTAPLDRDEATYFFVAREMMQGHLPYESVFDHKPPLIYLVYYLAQIIDSSALWLPRVFSAVTTALTILLTAYIAEKAFGKNSGIYTAFILIPMFSYPVLSPTFANTEIFMLLAMMLSFLCYHLYKKGGNTINFLLFGVFAAVSLLFKPLALFVFVFIAAVWLFNVFKKEGLENTIRGSLYILSGGIIVSCLILIPFIKENLEASFYEMVVVYNRQFALGPWFKRRIAKFTYDLFTTSPLLFLLPLWFIYKRPKSWWFYSGLIAASLLAIFKTDLGHYYLTLIPFWAMIVVYSINSLSEYLVKKYNLSLESTKKTIVSITAISIFIPFVGQSLIRPSKFTTYIHKVNNPFEEAVVVADELADISESTDTVYIAGHEPEILIYANRKSASKFIYAYPLVLNHPLKKKYQRQMMIELVKNKPDYIVLSSEYLSVDETNDLKEPVKFWNDFIKSNYRFVGGAVREKDDVFWKDANENTKLNKYRLLLYSLN